MFRLLWIHYFIFVDIIYYPHVLLPLFVFGFKLLREFSNQVFWTFFYDFCDAVHDNKGNPSPLPFVNFPLHLTFIETSDVHKHENHKILFLLSGLAECFPADIENSSAWFDHYIDLIRYFIDLVGCHYQAARLLYFG